MVDESYDEAIGILSDASGRYHNTIIRSQQFNAPRSTFNNVEGVQNNIVNVNVNHTVVDDSTSQSLRFKHKFLRSRLWSKRQT